MRTLQFKVTQQKLKKNGDFSGIVSGTKGYLEAAFLFSEEWIGMKKVAVFYRYHDKEYPVPIINGKCLVPEEVTGCTSWKVRVVGQNEECRITTDEEEVKQI